jgi:hypothetical protein
MDSLFHCEGASSRVPRYRSSFAATRRGLVRALGALFLISILLTLSAAQVSEIQKWTEKSSIVVRGRIVRVDSSDEPLLRATNNTVIITVLQMFSGTEFAGDLQGQNATVILGGTQRFKDGEELTFFGNPRFIGRSVTIADEGEVLAPTAGPTLTPELQNALQSRRGLPSLNRLEQAAAVFRGTVEAVHPLESEVAAGKRNRVRTSEHDPDWQVSTVRVLNGMRGVETGQSLTILFSASRDIEWFHAPKLKQGQEAVFIAHRPTKEELQSYREGPVADLAAKPSTFLVTEPFDVLPASEENRVRNLMATKEKDKETH